MKKLLLSLAVSAMALPALAHTDLLYQNFNNSWERNYEVMDLDKQAPATSIQAMFLSEGVYNPWHIGRDSNNSTDKFLMSHSYYYTPGQSNDWVMFPAITVPSENFNLTFDAQSVPIRGGEHALSDLWVFITEQPVTKDWQPTEPTLKIEQVGYGEDINNCENDWLHYTINLDKYIGKTVYISFANLNNDKDILALDNVLVRRTDLAELNCSAPEYILHGDYSVNVNIKGTDGEGLDNWKVTFKSGDVEKTETGAKLANGESKDFVFDAVVGSNEVLPYSVTLSSDNNADIVYNGTVTGMMFQTTKRIVCEETTFAKCGNCPLAITVFDALEEMEEYKDRILPVSIHVSSDDPMYFYDYMNMLGLGSSAPMVRVDRADEVVKFSVAEQVVDPTRENSAAYTIVRHLDEEALFDVEVSGTYLKNAGKVSGIDATAELTPAVDIDGSKYKIGFILTENNVKKPEGGTAAWNQSNYLTGDETGKSVNNPWAYLPQYVTNMRFQDVARQIYDYFGLENSLPATTLKAGEKVTFNTQLGLPTLSGSQGKLNPENLYLTVFVIENKDTLPKMLNANRVALGDNPEPRFTSLDMAKELGIDVAIDSVMDETFDGEAEYYNMQGIRVLNPDNGIYIVRRGGKVTKEVVKR